MKKVTIKEMQNISTKKPINENEMQKTIGGRPFWGWNYRENPVSNGGETGYYCVLGICWWRGVK